MQYHPGGWDELMKGVGKDATDMFNEVHSWVNYDSMLAACLVGKLVDKDEAGALGKLREQASKPPSAKATKTDGGEMLPPKPGKQNGDALRHSRLLKNK